MASAQVHVHFGVDAGVPITDTLSSSSNSSTSPSFSTSDRYNSVTKRLLIGPALRLEFGSGFGVEFDALYQRINYDHTTVLSEAGGTATVLQLPNGYYNQNIEQTTANRWQFPLLVQYSHKLPGRKTAFFVEGGPSISRIGNTHSNLSVFTNAAGSTPVSNTGSLGGQSFTTAGVVAGAGLDLPLFGLHLRPELRYSHWFNQQTIPAQIAASSGLLSAVPIPVNVFNLAAPLITTPAPSFRNQNNELSFILGLTF
jgi:hypothetical protein